MTQTPVPGPPLAPKSTFEQSRVVIWPLFEQTLWCVASMQVEVETAEQVPAQRFVEHVCVPSAHHTGIVHSVVASPTQMALRPIGAAGTRRTTSAGRRPTPWRGPRIFVADHPAGDATRQRHVRRRAAAVFRVQASGQPGATVDHAFDSRIDGDAASRTAATAPRPTAAAASRAVADAAPAGAAATAPGRTATAASCVAAIQSAAGATGHQKHHDRHPRPVHQR